MARISKHAVREKIWQHLREAGLARFPFPIQHRIPNFKDAEAAARRLAAEPFYKDAQNLKCNPDSPQRPVRLQALKDGKTVFMAVPRLREARCFLRLDPHRIDPENLKKAASIAGAAKFGVPVLPKEMLAIDLIVAGSVAVRENGARAGKGGGYSDLEFALATELGIVTPQTKIVSTVHDDQVVADSWQVQPYDIPLDYIVTPTRTIECRDRHPRPKGILWDLLKEEMLKDIPVLQERKRRNG